jgi:hypothetical protein
MVNKVHGYGSVSDKVQRYASGHHSVSLKNWWLSPEKGKVMHPFQIAFMVPVIIWPVSKS